MACVEEQVTQHQGGDRLEGEGHGGELKAKNRLIEFRDIFIAATAHQHNLPIATLNGKHFECVAQITLIELKSS